MKDKRLFRGVLVGIVLVALGFLCGGYTKDIKGEDAIKKDLVGKDIAIYNSVNFGPKLREPNEVKSLKITKREISVKDKKDIVYADVVFKDRNADLAGQLKLVYNYNNKGGLILNLVGGKWVLNSVNSIGDFKITPSERVSDERIRQGAKDDEESCDIKVLKSEFKGLQNILTVEIVRNYLNSVKTEQLEEVYELNPGYECEDKTSPYVWKFVSSKAVAEKTESLKVPFSITDEQFKKSLVGHVVSYKYAPISQSLKEEDIKSVEINKSSIEVNPEGTKASFDAKINFSDSMVPEETEAFSSGKSLSMSSVNYYFQDGEWKLDGAEISCN